MFFQYDLHHQKLYFSSGELQEEPIAAEFWLHIIRTDFPRFLISSSLVL